LTNFRRIDFPINLLLGGHWLARSKIEIIFRIRRPVFDKTGTKNFWNPPNISLNIRPRAPKFFGSLETSKYPKYAKFHGPNPKRGSQGARQTFEFFDFWPQMLRNRLVKSFYNFAAWLIFGCCMQQWKKIWGRSMRFWDIGGWPLKFWGVSITPNFLNRGGSNCQNFSSAENLKRICIKHYLQMMALSVLILELAGGQTFEFFAENLWPRSFAFLINFRRINFPINLIVVAQWGALSKF